MQKVTLEYGTAYGRVMKDLEYIEFILIEPGKQQAVNEAWEKTAASMDRHHATIGVPRQTAQRIQGTDTPQFTDAKSYCDLACTFSYPKYKKL